MSVDELDAIVKEAKSGSASAVEALVVALQDRIFAFALKFFWNPQDAEEATQEAFIKIVTKLDSFRGESKFSTWALKVASNHFLNLKSVKPSPQISFEDFEMGLDAGLAMSLQNQTPAATTSLLIFEAKAGCSLGMLQCLDHQNRMVYVLGEVLEFSAEEGAFILDISDADFRQRLHRSRERLHAFMNKNCGLVSKGAKCRCKKQVEPAISTKKINPSRLLFSDFASSGEIEEQIDSLINEVEIFHLTDQSKKPLSIAKHIKAVLATSVKSSDKN